MTTETQVLWHEEWHKFANRHVGNSFLRMDPLYSLDEGIIDAVKSEAPCFFTAEQERFERDLRRTASFGFFRRQALGITAQERQVDPTTGVSILEKQTQTVQSIRASRAAILGECGLQDGEVDDYFQKRAEMHGIIETRQHGYAGWLICNPKFRAEVGELQATWGTLIAELGRFPPYPKWPFLKDGVTDDQGELRKVCFAFYRRWGLERMITWDWPIPMEPDLGVGLLQDLENLSETGVVLVVPWYLLRGEKIDIQLAVQLKRDGSQPEHLRDWIHSQATKRAGDKGDIRFERIFWIYRYYELVFRRRYTSACRSNTERLDRAFARVIGTGEDSVKKLRQELIRCRRSV